MNVIISRREKAFQSTVASDLANFDLHKNAILAIFVRKRGLGPAGFDAEKLWRDLVRLADWYFSRKRMRETIPNPAPAKVFRQLAKALGRARALAKKEDVIDHLFRAMYEEANGPYTSAANQDFENSAVSRTLNKLDEARAGLLALETAASKAATDPRRRGGRPKGTSILPPEYIVRLAMLFRSSTGTRPGAGEGPFSRFVGVFLNAVGGKIADSAVIDAIKDARAQSFQQPSGWPSSPFK
jgi:hypothetical protein